MPAVKPVPEPVYNDSREEWHFVLSGSQTENSDQIFIQPARAVIVNHNKWLHYVFLSQDILPIVYDRVNEKLAKRQKELIEQFDDVKVTISRHGNKIVVDAIYDYINDEKDIKAFTGFGRAIARESDLEERMRVLMRESVDLISAIRFETKRAEKDARKDLENQALSYLDRSTFVFLINDGYESWDVMAGPKEGRWNFTGGETEAYYEIYNFGDHLVFSIVEPFPESTSEDQRAEIVKNVDAQVAKKSAKGANSMEVLLHPENTDYIWVKANLALDGKLKGKEVAESYADFKYKYAKEFRKKILNVFKDYEKAAEKSAKEAEDQTYSFVTQDDYLMLAPDDLSEFLETEGESQAVEGHWSIVMGDEERECEIFNHGDRIVYALAMAMPGEDEAIWTEVSEKIQGVVNEMPAKKSSSMEVTRYPGYEHYVWVKVTYALNGNIKGKDIAEQYKDFVYDYSEKMYKKISEVFAEYE